MEIATYYVTLQPTHDKGRNADGMHHIAFVDDPAIEEVGIYLQKHDPRIVADEQIKSKILEYLRGCGQEVPSHWREVTDEEYLAAKEVQLTTDPTSRESFNDFSNPKGGGQWLVRYKYFTPDGSPVIDTTRDFCRDIISLNRIYTEEEIKNGLSNPEFGNYSIFDYKGSYGCRHVWKRQIYYEDYEDDEVRKVGFVPIVVSQLDDKSATTLNAFLSKDEKMQVCAPLLIPDKDVYRNDEIGKYNMRFSAQTISDLRTLAASKGVLERKDLFKDTHEGGIAPSYVLKEWITENENDPAYTEYGFDVRRVPIGSWMVLSQITDKEFWNKEIKGNKKYAYSIEALINLTIIKMSAIQEFGDVVVFNKKGEFLILQRHENDDYEPNKICFAGGKIEKGEDIKVGALRELREETGINETDARFIQTIENSNGSKSHYFAVTTNQTFTPSDEHKAMSWVKNLDSIPKEMFIEGDKERLVNIIKLVKMENGKIAIPDGEHLINGTIYVFKDGQAVSTQEITEQQEEVIEEVVETAAEKPVEELSTEVNPEVEQMAAVVEEVTTEVAPEDDRMSKLESQLSEMVTEVATLRALIEKPAVDETVDVQMAKVPLWKTLASLRSKN
jgi:8-oxo-dGTP pyrophosphatase MutT (NUDIX family)